ETSALANSISCDDARQSLISSSCELEMQARSELSISENDTTAAHREAVERVILKMYDHLADPFSLSEMARTACISPFHFDRIFHDITGIPAVQFLYALRIEAAKRLLLTTSLSVTDVTLRDVVSKSR